MEKKHIIKFLNAKKREVYAITMALEIIREDLEKETREKVQLNYFSLAQATAKFKKNIEATPGTKKVSDRFKDANELEEKQTKPGGFKCPQ